MHVIAIRVNDYQARCSAAKSQKRQDNKQMRNARAGRSRDAAHRRITLRMRDNLIFNKRPTYLKQIYVSESSYNKRISTLC